MNKNNRPKFFALLRMTSLILLPVLTSCAQTLDKIAPPIQKETYIENVIVDHVETQKPFQFQPVNAVKLKKEPEHLNIYHISKNMVADRKYLYVVSEQGIERLSLKDKKWQSTIRISDKFKSPVLIEKKGDIIGVVGREGHVIVFDLLKNKIVFEKKLDMVVSSKPIIQKDRIYVQTSGDIIFCYDFVQNKELWMYQNRYAAGYKTGSSPILYKDFLITGFTNGDFSLIEKNTGLLHWNDSLYGQISFMGSDVIHVTAKPIVENDILYAVGSDSNLSAYKIYDGHLLWSKNISSQRDLLLNQGYLYILDKYGMIISVNKENGNIRIVSDLNPKLETPINFTNMVFVNDMIFLSALYKRHSAGVLINPKTGVIEKIMPVEDKIHDVGIFNNQLFALTENHLYVFSN